MSCTLSEFESKQFLSEAGIPVPPEQLVATSADAVRAAQTLGYPVALKLCGRGISHKTERQLVRLGLSEDDDVRRQAEDLLDRREPGESEARLLVSTMIQGQRELIAGLIRDPQFGPCVMFGLGGVFAEALGDVAFAVAPLEPLDADDLIDAISCTKVLGSFRGEPAADRAQLGQILQTIGRIGLDRPEVLSIDVNPLILAGSHPVVADALVELDGSPR
jgi:acetyl-CoA synthetase (ADP-forming)